MAHDDNVVSGNASAAEIYYEIRSNMRLASNAPLNEERMELIEVSEQLDEAIENVIFTFFGNGKVKSEEWHDDAGEVSRVGGPAVVYYEINGLSKSEEWYVDGKKHRLDGPAEVTYYTREDNRAIHTPKQETWYQNNEIHRDDGGPALRSYYEDGSINEERWFVHGQRHRVDGPAISAHYDNGNLRYETWYQHGEVHCEDGPAVVSYRTNGEVAETTWYNHDVPRS